MYLPYVSPWWFNSEIDCHSQVHLGIHLLGDSLGLMDAEYPMFTKPCLLFSPYDQDVMCTHAVQAFQSASNTLSCSFSRNFVRRRPLTSFQTHSNTGVEWEQLPRSMTREPAGMMDERPGKPLILWQATPQRSPSLGHFYLLFLQVHRLLLCSSITPCSRSALILQGDCSISSWPDPASAARTLCAATLHQRYLQSRKWLLFGDYLQILSRILSQVSIMGSCGHIRPPKILRLLQPRLRVQYSPLCKFC